MAALFEESFFAVLGGDTLLLPAAAFLKDEVAAAVTLPLALALEDELTLLPVAALVVALANFLEEREGGATEADLLTLAAILISVFRAAFLSRARTGAALA